MKKRAVCIILGVLLTGTMFTGCGKNKATEAASESAQTEKEGIGEDVEKDSETDKKSDKDSADKDTADKDTSSDKKTSATETPVATETGIPEEETETSDAEKIAILLPNEDEWTRDAKELEAKFTDDGYAPVIMYAQDDADEQASQVSDMTEEGVSAMVIAPVDPYGLSEELKAAKEAEIPVIAYDDLIMNTDGVKYYVTFGGRQIGQLIGQEIIDKEELDKLQEEKGSKTIELLMGSLDDTQALFFYNGLMEKLQPYLDDGTLVCKSGQITFEETGILRWSMDEAQSRAEDILEEAYQDGEAPDIICTGFDGAAEGAVNALQNNGLTPGENWPMITGVGCDADAVRDIAESEIACSVFMDRRVLADQAEDMVNVYLHGEDDPEVNDYEQYDNGTKIIASYLCEPQLINIDNYEILIDNGYYTEDEVKPETTPTPEPTVTPEITEEPDVTATPEVTESPEATITPEVTEESEETATPTPTEKVTPTPKERVTLKRSTKNK